MILGKIIKLNNDPMIDIDDDTEYSILGVRAYGKGVFVKPKVYGKNLQMKKYKVARENQLMWCKVDTKNGAFGVVKKEHDGCIASTNMALADINTKAANPIFVELLFRNPFFYNYINSRSTGTTNRKYLTPNQICTELEIPNLNIEEQELFVGKYKRFESSKIHSNVIRDQECVQKLRQAILQEAVSGKLVPQDPNDEPASELLKKIKAEKGRLIGEKRLKKEKILPPISNEEFPYEIPKGWDWVRLGEITTKIGSGSTPLGGKKIYEETGIPFIRSQNVWNTGLRLDDVVYITEEIHKKMEGTRVFPGDILLNITGASIGRTCIVPGKFKEGNVSQHVSIIRVISSSITSFVHFFLLSSYLQNRIMDVQVGVSREGLSKKNMELFLIPIPPLSEQNRIIQKLDQLLKLCNVLEEKIKENQSCSELITEAVLKEAFAS